MARQGCRNHRFAFNLILAIAGLGCIARTHSIWALEVRADEPNQPVQSLELDYRLELTWTSSVPRIWAGEIQIASRNAIAEVPGRLSEPGNLTPGMLLTGGIHVSPPNDVLRFAPPPSTSYLRDRQGQFIGQQTTTGGVAFRVRGSESDRVLISLRRDDSNEFTTPIAVSFAELSSGRSIESRFSDSASWSLKRVDGDRLRVSLVPQDGNEGAPAETRKQGQMRASASDLGRSTSLYWDDQTAAIEVHCDNVDDDALELICETFVAGDRVIAPQVWPVSLVAGKGTITESFWQPLSGDGGYELRWRLQRRTNARTGWGVSIPDAFKDTISRPMTMIRGTSENPVIAESKMTVVVLSRQPTLKSDLPATDSDGVVGRIEPFGKSWAVSRFIPVRQATQFVAHGLSPVAPKRSIVADKTVAELLPGDYWEHAIPVAKIGERHRLTLTFPDAKAMRLGICILDQTSQAGKQFVHRDVTCVRTRMKTSDTGWATAEVDFYPQSSSPQLVLINRDAKQSAVFEAIDITTANQNVAASSASAIPPAATSTASSYPLARAVLMQVDSSQWLESFGDLARGRDVVSSAQGNVFVAAQRLIETIKRQGYAGVMMTVCQDGRSLYRTDLMTVDRSGDRGSPIRDDRSPETLEMLLRLFDRESLAFVPCIRANAPLTPLEKALIDGGPAARGISPSNPWSGFDLSLGEVESIPTCVYSPLHEMVTSACVDMVDELLQKTANHPCVQTIGVLADEGSCFRLPARRATMDNATMDRFHATLPEGKVARSQVVGWISEEGAAAFDLWRAERLRDMVRQWLRLLDESDKTLLMATSCDQVPIELLELAAEPRLIFTRLHRRNQLASLAERWRDEATSLLSYVSGEPVADSTFRAALYLVPQAMVPTTEGDKELLRFCGLASTATIQTRMLQDPIASSLALAKLLSRRDRVLLILSGTELSGVGDTQRRSLATFHALPPTLMDEIPASDDAMKLVKLRRVAYEGATYLMATNHSRWAMNVDVALTNTTSIRNVCEAMAAPAVSSGGVWRAWLQSGELTAVRIPSDDVKVRSWSAQIAGGAMDTTEIGGTVREIADAIASNTEPQLCRCIENANFEAEPQAATSQSLPSRNGTVVPETSNGLPVNVPGWLMAQHPIGCAVLDQEVAFEGQRSIRLSNRDGRPGGTWIVSRAIPIPASGRIAMSLMVRGEPSEDPTKSSPIILRVAIEGAVAGSSMRQLVSVKVARDGKWSTVPCRVEVASLPRCEIDSLRLAIDVMNEGTVWIDDVRAEEFFLTANEKTQLQSQLFLALGGIAKGDLSQAAKLLESHWVQEILGQPVVAPIPALLTNAETLDGTVPVSDNGPVDGSTPGIAERIKAWLPRPIRF